MKVVIAGTRPLRDEDPRAYELRLKNLYKTMVQYIESLNLDITEVISGDAQGPDMLGEIYASVKNIPCKIMKADWNKHGKAAGPIRNKEMAEYGDCAIIFWDGISRGTKNMINNMYKLNKPAYIRIIENG